MNFALLAAGSREEFPRRAGLDQPAAMQQHNLAASRLAWPRSCVDITTLTPRAAIARTTSSIILVA